MKIKDVLKLLQKEFNQLEFVLKDDEKDMISFNATATIKDYRGDVYADFVVYDSGTFHVFYTFDRLDRTEENLNLINDFNASEPFIKAYIIKKGEKPQNYLELHYAGSGEDAREIADKIADLMTRIVGDEFKKTFVPIVDLTY